MTTTREIPVSTPPCRYPFYNDLGREGDYYYNARWYDAETGRFISEDPARDGLNWYVYVSNNPLKYIDPTGMMSDSAAFAAAQTRLDIENSDSQYGHTYIRDEYDYKDFSKMLEHIEKSSELKIENNEKRIDELKGQIQSTEIEKRSKAAENFGDIAKLGITFDNGSFQDIAEFVADSQLEPLDYNLDLSEENKKIFGRIKDIFNLKKENNMYENGAEGARDLLDDIHENQNTEKNNSEKDDSNNESGEDKSKCQINTGPLSAVISSFKFQGNMASHSCSLLINGALEKT